MKKLIFSLVIAVSFNSYSQTNYFVYRTDDGTDTIFTKNINYKLTAQGYLGNISYTDLEGKSWEMDGKKKFR